MTRSARLLATLLLLLLALGLAACPKKKPKKVVADDTPTPTATPAATPTPDVDALMKGQATDTMADLTNACGAQPLHFDLDSSTLPSAADVTLKVIVECLRNHPNWALTAEGHADERGSTQYNLALGEKRARTVVKWIADQGVEKTRLDTVSFGEEKPAENGHDEAAWAMNRRVEFRIKQH